MSYAFGLYSLELQRRFRLSQQQLDQLGTFIQLGANVGVHVGLFYERCGARATLGVAAALGVPVWLLTAAALHGTLALSSAQKMPVLSVVSLLQGQVQLIGDAVVVAHFSCNRLDIHQ